MNATLKKIYFSLFCMGAMLLYTCRENPSPSSQNNLNQLKEPAVNKELSEGIQNTFAIEAALGTLMEIESSAHMIKLTENRDVQNLATIMVKDHGMAQTELNAIAKKENLYLPQKLNPEQQQILNQLDSLKEDQRNHFYSQLMVKEHEKAVKLFESASQAESNEALKNFASAKLPTLKHHLAESRKVFKYMQKIAGDKGDYSIDISKSGTGN
ncbi:MAG: DUF4142 domain-containing protein [Pedobacter sp.]|nr:MAG: DUF4142 domain-containing protein [Pedobacter sp.]